MISSPPSPVRTTRSVTISLHPGMSGSGRVVEWPSTRAEPSGAAWPGPAKYRSSVPSGPVPNDWTNTPVKAASSGSAAAAAQGSSSAAATVRKGRDSRFAVMGSLLIGCGPAGGRLSVDLRRRDAIDSRPASKISFTAKSPVGPTGKSSLSVPAKTGERRAAHLDRPDPLGDDAEMVRPPERAQDGPRRSSG